MTFFVAAAKKFCPTQQQQIHEVNKKHPDANNDTQKFLIPPNTFFLIQRMVMAYCTTITIECA